MLLAPEEDQLMSDKGSLVGEVLKLLVIFMRLEVDEMMKENRYNSNTLKESEGLSTAQRFYQINTPAAITTSIYHGQQQRAR